MYLLILMFYYMHNNNNYQCKICWNKALTFGVGSIKLSFRIYHCVHAIHAKMFSIQMLLHFSQIVPRVCTFVLFIYIAFGQYVNMGQYVYIGQYVNMGQYVYIGQYVNMGQYVYIGQYVNMDQYVYIGQYVNMGQYVYIGQYVNISVCLYWSVC